MNPTYIRTVRTAVAAIVLIASSLPAFCLEHKNRPQVDVRPTTALNAIENMNKQLAAIEKERRLVIKNIPEYLDRITWKPVSKRDHDLLVSEINRQAKRKADRVKQLYQWARRRVLAEQLYSL